MQNSGILFIFPAIILNRMLLIIIWYFIFGISLIVLASVSASRFWPRLTSLLKLHLFRLSYPGLVLEINCYSYSVWSL